MKRGEGVLSTNAMQDQRFEEGESIQDYGIRSAIAVPIKSRDAILGIIHVDTHVSQGQFSPEDLKLMTAIGSQTGLAVANARLMASQVQQERLAAVGQAITSLSHATKNILQGIQGGSHAVESGLASNQIEPVASAGTSSAATWAASTPSSSTCSPTAARRRRTWSGCPSTPSSAR